MALCSKLSPAIDLDQICDSLVMLNYLGIRHLTDQPAELIVRSKLRSYMRIGRVIVAVLLALSLAMLPMARAFIAPNNEATASEVVAASAPDCSEHEAMASDVVVALAHECCDLEAMPVDHGMKGCRASADCIAKCSSLYAVLFSEEAIPSAIGGTERRFVSKPFYSRTASPPFRPPRA
jgi:hypothetical protein